VDGRLVPKGARKNGDQDSEKEEWTFCR